MKALIFRLMAFFLIGAAHLHTPIAAQPYVPFLEDGKLIDSHYQDFWHYINFINGDTIIKNHKCKKVIYSNGYCSPNEFYSNVKKSRLCNAYLNTKGGYYTFLRDSFPALVSDSLCFYAYEDTIMRKVFSIGRNSDTFKLWYDFSIPAIGEIRRGEIGGYGMHPQSAVKEIGYVVDNNGVRRRYWVNSNVWVEGLGCLHNGAGNPGFSRFSNNVAFAVKGIPVYVDSRLGIDGRNSSSSCSSLTFNIVDNILSYTTKPMGYASPSGTDCTIYAANGATVGKQAVQIEDGRIDLSRLSHGLYLAVVTTSAGEVLGRHKFVVK